MNPIDYYNKQLNNPLTAFLDNLPTGEALNQRLAFLPPKPDDAVRALPKKKRLALLHQLKRLHICLGRDRQLAGFVFDLIRDGLSARPPTAANMARRAQAVAKFAKNVATRNQEDFDDADIEAIGGALIGISGMGKTRTLKRILRLIEQVIEFDVAANPLLPVKMVTYIRVECPSNRTTTALIASIFTAIEKTIAEALPVHLKNGNMSVLAHNIGQVCAEYSLGVLIIDEVQHALRHDGQPEPQLLNFFVELSNTLEVPIILVGTPRAQQVVGRQMRQARRMLGPEWSNLKKDSIAYADFIREMSSYQFTRHTTPFSDYQNKFYELTQGVPALAIALFRLAQSYVIHLEPDDASDDPTVMAKSTTSSSPVRITEPLLQAVYDDYFQNVDPMVKALRSGNPESLMAYEDLKFDAEAMEVNMLNKLAAFREHLHIKLLKAAAAAGKKASKIVKTQALSHAEKLAEKPVTPVTDNPKLIKAFDAAVKAGDDPGKAVSEAAP